MEESAIELRSQKQISDRSAVEFRCKKKHREARAVDIKRQEMCPLSAVSTESSDPFKTIPRDLRSGPEISITQFKFSSCRRANSRPFVQFGLAFVNVHLLRLQNQRIADDHADASKTH